MQTSATYLAIGILSGPRRGSVRIALALAAGAVIVLGLAGRAGGQAVGMSVYYQVTYADGTVRDLAEAPGTSEGILRIVRIARVDEGGKGYEILSTGRRVISQVDQPRTFTRDMQWDGRAWPPRPLPEDLLPPPASAPAGPPPQAMLNAVARVESILEVKRARLGEYDRAVAEAEAALAKAQGAEAEAAARRTWNALRSARKECSDCVAELQDIQALLLAEMPATMPAQGLEPGKPDPFDQRSPSRILSRLGGLQPQGQVDRLATGQAGESEIGVVRPIENKIVPPHRIQVWSLPPGRGERTFRVMMAHGEAGPMGAFHYVAYADTDDDGLPDKLIAYSPLATAEVPGGWTGWTFSTAHGRVFVGNAWPHRDTCVFARTLEGEHDNWRGMGTEVYVSGDLRGLPRHRYRWPYFSNIRVRVADQNPE